MAIGGRSDLSDVSVETSALHAFGATHQGLAGDIAAAGNFDAAGHVAALTPVFGLIGADYLALFAAAQLLQVKDINDLAGRFAELGNAAFGTAADYDSTDAHNAGALGAAGKQIGVV